MRHNRPKISDNTAQTRPLTHRHRSTRLEQAMKSKHLIYQITALLLLVQMAPTAIADSWTTKVISRGKFSTTANAGSAGAWQTVVSGNGRFIAYSSDATDLVPDVDDRNSDPDLYLQDRLSGDIVLVSHAAGQALQTADDSAGAVALSDDGEWLVFVSRANNLISGVTDSSGFHEDAYLYQRSTGQTTLISRSASNPMFTAGGNTYPLQMSPDGSKILLVSSASNLVSGLTDHNGVDDLFLFDRNTGTFTLVSRAAGSATTTANSHSSLPVMTPDGRYVAFQSAATNLVSGVTDANSGDDVFVIDLATGVTQLVTHRFDNPLIATGQLPYATAISNDGEKILFGSQAFNLVPGTTEPDYRDKVFLFDRSTNTVSMVSHAHNQALKTADSGSWAKALSADGRWVLFDSNGSDILPPGSDANGTGDVFLRDMQTDAVTAVSRNFGSAFSTANNQSTGFGMDPTGQRILFTSQATNLLAGANIAWTTTNVYAFNRTDASISMLSHASGNPLQSGNESSDLVAMSPDANVAAIRTEATDFLNLTDYNWKVDLYTVEIQSGNVALMSRSAVGLNPTAGGSSAVAISGNGQQVLFGPGSPYIDQADNAVIDRPSVFTFDRGDQGIRLRSNGWNTNNAADDQSYGQLISRDTVWLVLQSRASNFLPGITYPLFRELNLYLVNQQTGARSLVSHAIGSPNVAANGESIAVDMTPDARCILFKSKATNLAPGVTDTNLSYDVFLYDRNSNDVSLITRAAGGAPATGNGQSIPIAISDDCNIIVYDSVASNLIDGLTDTNSRWDVFAYRRNTNTTTLVSRAFGNPLQTMNTNTNAVGLSANGQRILFTTTSTMVSTAITDNSPFGPDTYLFEVPTSTITLAGRQLGNPNATPTSGTSAVALSEDGNTVIFGAGSTDIIAGLNDSNFSWDVFAFNVANGETRLISHKAQSPNTTSASGSSGLALSGDGNVVLFESSSVDLVTTHQDTNQYLDLFIGNLQTGETTLVTRSRLPYLETIQDQYFPVGISDDGNQVVFDTFANNVGDGSADGNGVKDAYLFTRVFTLDFQAGPGGSILPGGPVPVEAGLSRSFAVSPNQGMVIQSVSGCGAVSTGPGTYSTGPIQADCTVTATFVPGPSADLSVTLDDGFTTVGDAQLLEYQLTVQNAGPDAMNQTALSFQPAIGLSSINWQCDAQASTIPCPSPSSGTGLPVLLLSLPVGTHLSYRIHALVTALPGATTSLSASIAPPFSGNSLVPENDTATDTATVFANTVFSNGFE